MNAKRSAAKVNLPMPSLEPLLSNLMESNRDGGTENVSESDPEMVKAPGIHSDCAIGSGRIVIVQNGSGFVNVLMPPPR